MTVPKTASPKTTAAPRAKKAPLTEAEKKARADLRKQEGKGMRFLRVAKPRVQKAVVAITRLETIGRSAAYEFTPEQAASVMRYIDGAVEKLRLAFVARVNKREAETITL